MKEIIIFYDSDNLMYADIIEDTFLFLSLPTRKIEVKNIKEAEKLYKEMIFSNQKPYCVIVYMEKGLELINIIDEKWGNNVVTGIVFDKKIKLKEYKAQTAGAYFSIVKNPEIINNLKKVKEDFFDNNKTKDFKNYK